MEDKELSKKVVERVQMKKYNFKINGNEELTDIVKELIVEKGWPDFEVEESDDSAKELHFKSPDEAYLDSALGALKDNKDITILLPKDTRFYFVKRVIKKIMKVTTRYQEVFNNEIYRLSVHNAETELHFKELFGKLSDEIYESKKEIKQCQIQIEEQRKEIEYLKRIMKVNKD